MSVYALVLFYTFLSLFDLLIILPNCLSTVRAKKNIHMTKFENKLINL